MTLRTDNEETSVRGISSMATREVLSELGDAFTCLSGQRVDVVSVGGVDAARRVRDAEPFDFVVLAAEAMEQLAAAGHVDAGSRTDVARCGIAIAVRKGAPRPDIDSESALRDAVQRARSIGYSTGPSGVYVAQLFERWGISALVAQRLVQAPPGVAVGTLVARGDVEIGFQQLAELMHLPGIDVVGALPASIQLVTTFTAAVCSRSSRPDGARRFLAFIASADADAVKRRHGLEPA